MRSGESTQKAIVVGKSSQCTVAAKNTVIAAVPITIERVARTRSAAAVPASSSGTT